MTPILDVTAGSRMFWWDKHNPSVTFLDKRDEVITFSATDKSPERKIVVSPDVVGDFTHLPFDDNSYYMVVFDPPHLLRAGDHSWLKAKYGLLNESTWQSDLRHGYQECMRVLRPNGTLIFKWNDEQIKLAKVLKAIKAKPLFGDKRSKTHWLVFMKTEAD